jgi:hypothetical protein
MNEDLPESMRTQTEINRASIERHLKDAWTVAIHTYGSRTAIVKAIEDAMGEMGLIE